MGDNAEQYEQNNVAARALMELRGDKTETKPAKPKSGKVRGLIKSTMKTFREGIKFSSKRKRAPNEKEPNSSDNSSIKKTKKRRRIPITQEQKARLEHVFQYQEHPNRDHKQALAEELKMAPRRVQIWFQNRRAKARKERQKRQNDRPDEVEVPRYTDYQRQTYNFGTGDDYSRYFDTTRKSKQYPPKRRFYIPPYFRKLNHMRRKSVVPPSQQPDYAKNAHPNFVAPLSRMQNPNHPMASQQQNQRLPRLAELDLGVSAIAAGMPNNLHPLQASRGFPMNWRGL